MAKGLIVILAAFCFLALSAAFYYKQSEAEARQSSALYKHNSDILYHKLREAYENNVKAQKTKKELAKAAHEDKTGFDWNADISHSPVILRLQAD